MKWICSFLMFLGRVSLGAVFLWIGVQRILHYDVNLELVASKGIKMAPLFLIGSLILQFVGSLFLIFGYRARLGALVLIVYLIPATLLFHDFWVQPAGPAFEAESLAFFKNLAIFGGLLYVLSNGGGCCSTSSCCQKKIED